MNEDRFESSVEQLELDINPEEPAANTKQIEEILSEAESLQINPDGKRPTTVEPECEIKKPALIGS